MARKTCQHRSLKLGRTFCALATLEGERGTSEVYPETCESCKVEFDQESHPCVHLDIGLEVTSHRDRSTIDHYYYGCRVTQSRLEDPFECGESCPDFEPTSGKKAPTTEGEKAGADADPVS